MSSFECWQNFSNVRLVSCPFLFKRCSFLSYPLPPVCNIISPLKRTKDLVWLGVISVSNVD